MTEEISQNDLDVQALEAMRADFLEESEEHFNVLDRNLAILEQSPENLDCLEEIFRRMHTLKGTASFTDLSEINKISHLLEDVLSVVRTGKAKLDKRLFDLLFDGLLWLKKLRQAAIKNQPPQSIALFVERLEKAIEHVQEKELPVLIPSTPSISESWEAAGKTLRIQAEKLETIMNLAGELIVSNNKLDQYTKEFEEGPLIEITGNIQRIAVELHREVVEARLTPISSLFNLFYGIVRNFSSQKSRKINLQIAGGETLLDKKIKDALYEPFIHIFQNALDHGIELPEERGEIGKEPDGTIHISAEMVKKIADGDLQNLYEVKSEDEIGQLGMALNETTQRLREIIQSLLSLIKVLSKSSYQIFSSSQDISRGADNQASLVFKASSAIDNMSSSIQNIVSTVNDAAKSAESATQLAGNGARQMGQTGKEITEASDLIKELNEQAKGVKKISRVIQEISAQTNILSLNAAIEASRAGEHGKGFNVISNEIRALSRRTSQSAEEISKIIDSLQSKMLESTQIISTSIDLIHNAGESLKNISEGITSTNQMVKTIAIFTNQQAQTSKDIAESLQDISRISQYTASGAKKAVESNKGISDMSYKLEEIAQRFKI